jgi:hypothetical protein
METSKADEERDPQSTWEGNCGVGECVMLQTKAGMVLNFK